MDVPPSYTSRMCTKCGRTLPLEDFYVKDKKTGRRFARCKECYLEQSHSYYREHREEHKESVVRWQKEHPEQAREIRQRHRATEKYHETTKAWTESEAGKESRKRTREKFIEKRRAYNARYREAHRAEIRAYNARYYREHADECGERIRRSIAANPEKYQEIHRTWKQAHNAVINSHTHKRRAILRGSGGVVSAFEWERIKAQHDWRCAWCGKQEMTDGLSGDGLVVVAEGHKTVTLCRDHIIPLRPGLNIASNLQPLCRSCNSVKHRRLLRRRP